MSIPGKLYVWEECAKYAPDEPGIYAFYNEDRVLIYLGGSANLRETFTRYFETDFSDDTHKRETKYYKRLPIHNWKERAKELLEEYKQKHGSLPKLNTHLEPPEKMVDHEMGFHFYDNVEKSLSEAAFSLKGFQEKIGKVPVSSLEFHQRRGDFARWIRDVFEETHLADRIDNIHKTGEDLRRELLNSLRNPEIAECPECRAMINPIKKWKMTGNPSKTGEKLQLTIGLYKCNKCKKTFRKVVKKEKIKP